MTTQIVALIAHQVFVSLYRLRLVAKEARKRRMDRMQARKEALLKEPVENAEAEQQEVTAQ